MFISLAAFTVYGALGYQLTAAIAFPAISLFNLLRFPLMMLPEQILNLIQVVYSQGKTGNGLYRSHCSRSETGFESYSRQTIPLTFAWLKGYRNSLIYKH